MIPTLHYVWYLVYITEEAHFLAYPPLFCILFAPNLYRHIWFFFCVCRSTLSLLRYSHKIYWYYWYYTHYHLRCWCEYLLVLSSKFSIIHEIDRRNKFTVIFTRYIYIGTYTQEFPGMLLVEGADLSVLL